MAVIKNEPVVRRVQAIDITQRAKAHRVACNILDDLGDPVPPPEGSDSRGECYRTAVKRYAVDMLNRFRTSALLGKDLWLDYTATFHPHTIAAMSHGMQFEWNLFLEFRGVPVALKPRVSRATVLIECLLANDYADLQ